LDCGTSKKFVLDRNFSLWNDKPENIFEIITVHTEGAKKKLMDSASKDNSLKPLVKLSNYDRAISYTDEIAIQEVIENLLTVTAQNIP